MGDEMIRKGKVFVEASLLSKVVAGVVTGILIAMIVSGATLGGKLYTFVNSGPRFTPNDYLRSEIEQEKSLHDLYVGRDVYAGHVLRIKRIEASQLRMEQKIDRILQEK